MKQNDALCEACCRQHGRIYETCNNGCHIRDLFEKLTAERDAAVADLREITEFFSDCTTCKYANSHNEVCNFCGINEKSKWEWRGLSLDEKTSDKEGEA